jgi:hypothetical protein
VEHLPIRDEEFMSAAEKKLVLRAWISFLKHGCRREHFTQRLYQHLSLHCSFIAHYNGFGFYDFYFTTPGARTITFLDQFDPNKAGLSAEMGDIYWLGDNATAADLNRAMRDAARPYVDQLRLQFQEMERQADLAIASALLRKHGKGITDCPSPAQEDVGRKPAATPRNTVERVEQLSIFAE